MNHIVNNIANLIEQLRDWADELERRLPQDTHAAAAFGGILAGMREVADDLERQHLLAVEDIESWEEAEPSDKDVSFVLDSANLIHALDEGFARVDPETQDIFTLAWVRVGKVPEPTLPSDHETRWRLASWPAGAWQTLGKAPLKRCLQNAKRLIYHRKSDEKIAQVTIELLDPSGAVIHNEEDLVRMYEAGELP